MEVTENMLRGQSRKRQPHQPNHQEQERQEQRQEQHAVNAPPICVECQRLHTAVYGKWGMFCDAFPEGIPDAIKMTRVDHREPYAGDHDLQFLARSPASEGAAARLIAAAHLDPAIATMGEIDLSNDWLYGWGNLPTTLDGLKRWLIAHKVTIKDFKNSARYEANYDRFPWLKDL